MLFPEACELIFIIDSYLFRLFLFVSFLLNLIFASDIENRLLVDIHSNAGMPGNHVAMKVQKSSF